MAQYKKGKIHVDYDSTTVYGEGTMWNDTVVQENFIFTIAGENNFYSIDSFVSYKELELKQPYKNKSRTSVSNKEYSIITDYTTNLTLPLIKTGDINWVGVYTKALRLLDSGLYKLGHYSDTGISYVNLEPIEEGTTTELSGGGSVYTPYAGIGAKEGKLIYDDYLNALLLCTGECVSASNVSGDTFWYTQWQQISFS